MPSYRVVCTRQEPPGQPHTDAHIVSVGTGTPASHSRIWTVADVYAGMDAGDAFYTESVSTQVRAQVNKWSCRTCSRPTLKSSADSIRDNNLDNLPRCT